MQKYMNSVSECELRTKTYKSEDVGICYLHNPSPSIKNLNFLFHSLHFNNVESDVQGETDLGEVGMMVEIRSEHVEISLEEEE